MASDRARLGTSEPSLSPELIEQRGFLTARRGFEPGEVKSFLAQVANEVRALRHREAVLERACRDAEDRAAHPSFDENTLMAAVGEETASILRSAHTAAADIKKKAEDNAARILKEGHDQVAAMRGEAETVLGQRTAEAEAQAARISEAAGNEAQRVRDSARQEAEAVRAHAEAERKVTIDAAQGARERILSDLTRRRKVAMVQIEQLRAGRERLLEAYKVVRRTLDDVTGELQRADGEARAAAEAAGRRPLVHEAEDPGDGDSGPGAAAHGPGLEPAPAVPSAPEPPPAPEAAPEGERQLGVGAATPAEPAGPTDPGAGRPSPRTQVLQDRRVTSFRVLRRQKETNPGSERPAEAPRPANGELTHPVPIAAPVDGEALIEPAPPADAGAEDLETAGIPDPDTEITPDETGSVDGLFARIRADRERAVVDARQVLAEPPVAGDPDRAVAGETGDAPVIEGGDARADPERIPAEDEAVLQRRDHATGAIEANLARKLKRALQDEQNDLLDRMRGLRSPPTAALVLPPRDAHAQRFAEAGRPLLGKAAKAGATFAASLADPPAAAAADGMPDVDDLAAELAQAVVEPLRRRLEQAFTDGDGDDPAVLVEALGAAYREWKTQRIEQTAADHIGHAFARGAFAATPEGTRLRWLVDDVDGPCPDCDDNALAGGLVKGEPFPTGQRYPPAHAGCRCLLVP